MNKQYLEEARYRGFIVVALFIASLVTCVFFSKKILVFIVSLFPKTISLSTLSPFEYINTLLMIAFFSAIVLNIPNIIYQLVAFISPTLTKKEKVLLKIVLPSSIVLFGVGVTFGVFFLNMSYKISLQLATNIQNIWSVSKFINTTITILFFCGLLFQLPLVLTALIQLKIITVKMLEKHRKFAILAIVCLVALLPPTDILSLALLSIPMVLLYESSILISKIINKQEVRIW